MFSDRQSDDLFNSLVHHDQESAGVEQVNINIQNVQLQEDLLEILNDQISGNETFKLDIVSQISSFNSIQKRNELYEEVINFIVAKYDFEIDIFEIKTDSNLLYQYARNLYDIAYYDTQRILSLFVWELFRRSTNFTDNLFKSLIRYKEKIDVNKLKKNTPKDSNDYKMYFIINDVFKDLESFRVVFGNEQLYNEAITTSNITPHSVAHILSLQPPTAIYRLFLNHVFSNSFQRFIFVNQIRNHIILTTKDEQVTKTGL